MSLRFRDWPLRWKLLLPPGLLLVATLLAATVSTRMIAEQRRAAADLSASFAMCEQRRTVLRMAMMKSEVALLRSITWHQVGADPAVSDTLRGIAEQRLDGVRAQVGLFVEERHGAGEAPLLGAVRREVERYEAAARDVLLMLGTDVGMALTYLSEAERRFADAEAAISDWELFHDDLRTRLEEEAGDRLRHTLIGIAAAVMVAFGGVVAATVVLSRAISVGVRDVTQVMGRLAAGDKTVTVARSDRGDEIGEMIRAVSVFKETALALDRLAADRVKAEEENRVALEREMEKLAESEQRFRDIAESSSDWFWETDDQDRLIMLSDRFYEVTALSPEQVLGRSRLEYAKSARTQEDAAKWVSYAKNIALRLPFRDLDYRVPGKKGREVYVRSSGKPFFAKNGDFVGYRGASSDVTALIRAQQQV